MFHPNRPPTRPSCTPARRRSSRLTRDARLRGLRAPPSPVRLARGRAPSPSCPRPRLDSVALSTGSSRSRSPSASPHFVAVVGLVRNRQWAARLDRLPRRDRDRRRRLRTARDHHRPRPVRRDELPAGARGQGRGPRAHGLDDRPLAGRRALRHPRRRADRSTGRSLRWPRRALPDAAAAGQPGTDSNPRRPTRTILVVRVYVICHAADGTFAG